MKTLRNFQLAASTVGVALGVVTCQFCVDWLTAQGLPLVTSIMFSLVIVAVSYLIFRFGATSFVRNCRWLRKLLLRGRFVEGVWREIVIPQRTDPILVAASIKYDAQRNNIRYGGHIFTIEGQPAGFFKTDMGLLAWPVFHYKYTWSRDIPGKSTEGYGKLQFSETSGYPGYYEGLVVDLENGTRLRFVGWKVQDRKEERKFADLMKKPESMMDIMKEFAEVNSCYWCRQDDHGSNVSDVSRNDTG